ncbi:putative acetyltransferase [Orbus hercynius]|uniref:Putative acetyltransferase n=1 Tax=Orbus hercynius TaxID=593135 RepID=A0A495RCV3_9GAMM|nr:GNAT family N-acetyltransferase [Orbus hercynius]RKS85110.1 putative acetyltransferase [Orbus hercynius]
MVIRQALKSDHPDLLALWSRSVTVTHDFLTAQDIAHLYQGLQDQWLDAVQLWVLETSERIVGFIGFDDNKVEMLFIDDGYQGKGYGTQLIDFAKQRSGLLRLDVNEQNPQALAFYQQQGFTIEGYSETDFQGNPFPLLHLLYRQ